CQRVGGSEEELLEDSEAMAGLEPSDVHPEKVKKSRVHTLTFPAQQHKLGPGEAVDPATQRGEDIVEIDDARGVLRLRRGPKFKDEPLPRALIPGGPWDTRAQRAALRRLAEEVHAPNGRFRALR